MNSDMKQRLMSATPIALGMLFLLGYGNVFILIGLCAMVGGVAICEFCHLLKKQQISLPQYTMVFCSIVIVSSAEFSPFVAWALVLAKFALSCFMQEKDWRQDLLFAMALFWIPLPLAHLVALSQLQEGSSLLVLVVLSIWVVDSAAYLGGKRWGKVKLCPGVSPGKTVEGALCGVLAGIVFAVISMPLLVEFLSLFDALIVGVAIGIVGQLGDLIESRLKRFCDAKDSGYFLAGHGGVLDRLDSVLPSLVVVYYLALVL